MRLLQSQRGILAVTISLLLGLAFPVVILSQNFWWVGALGVVISGSPIAAYYRSSPRKETRTAATIKRVKGSGDILT